MLRFPKAPPVVLCGDQSAWALPEHGLFGLSLAAGTRYTALWARLVLVDPAGAATRVLLLADQFERADWRKLQVALRECDTMDMGVVGRDPRSRAGR